MKGITFGYMILFMLLLSLIVSPIAVLNGKVSAAIYGTGSLLLLLYWIYGMIVRNPAGYIGCD
jgi:hypothetical protein